MAAIPLTSQSLDGFDRGSNFSYVLTLAVDANLTDPATWTAIRFSVVDNGGLRVSTDLTGQTKVAADGTSSPAGSGVLTRSSTGSGPWTLTLTIPVSGTQSAFLSAGTLTWQLDYTAANGASDDLITRSLVVVSDPTVSLP